MGTSVRKILKKEENRKAGKSENRIWAKPYAFLILYISLFLVLCWYFLYVKNADLMYFMQDRGWWNSTSLYFKDCISVPGGLLAWTGSYLTQYFYYPALGSVLLIGLWLLTFFLAKWSFKVPSCWSFLLFIPMVALLVSDIQLGYWVYILKDIDYVFYHPLGLFSALFLSSPFWRYLPVKKESKQYVSLLWIPLVAVLFYYPLGIYALLAAVLSFLNFFIDENKETSGLKLCLMGTALLFLSIWLVPLLETSGTTLMRPDQPWTYGFHRFELDSLRDYSLEIPFYLVLIVPLFFPFIKLLGTKRLLLSQSIMMLVALAALYSLSERLYGLQLPCRASYATRGRGVPVERRLERGSKSEGPGHEGNGDVQRHRTHEQGRTLFQTLHI